MYKIIIVDDEVLIRNGLRNYFPWESVGFEVVASFENGKLALDYINENRVDVMITDIKMPFMDGLELASLVHENYPDLTTIFLTGHRDFDYAQKAIKYNVKRYIVKPTKYNELFKIFTELRDELDKKHTAHQEQGYYNDIVNQVKTYVIANLKDANLNSAATYVNITPSYLSKIFTKYSDLSFLSFMQEAKMEKAKYYLTQTNMKTYEISESLGYATPKNFTRTFRNYVGFSPRDYRYNKKSDI